MAIFNTADRSLLGTLGHEAIQHHRYRIIITHGDHQLLVVLLKLYQMQLHYGLLGSCYVMLGRVICVASLMPLMLSSALYVAVGDPHFCNTYTQTDIQHTHTTFCVGSFLGTGLACLSA